MRILTLTLATIALIVTCNAALAQELDDSVPRATMRYRIRNDASYNLGGPPGFGRIFGEGGGGRSGGGGGYGGSPSMNGPITRLQMIRETDGFNEMLLVIESFAKPPMDPAKFKEIAEQEFQEHTRVLVEAAETVQKQQDKKLETLKKKQETLRGELDTLQANLQRIEESAVQAGFTADRAQLDQALMNLQQHRQELELEKVAQDARQKAISQRLEELNRKAELIGQGDAVAEELRKVVDARERQLQRIQEMVKTGQAAQTDADDASVNIAEAKARLAERIESVRAQAGGDIVSNLSAELVNLSIASAVTEAQLNAIIERVLRATQVLGNVRVDKLREAIDQRKAALDKVQEMHSEEELRRSVHEGPAFEVLETTFPPVPAR